MALDIVLFSPALLFERPLVVVSAAAWFVSQKRTGTTTSSAASTGALRASPSQDPVQLFAQLAVEVGNYLDSKDELKKVVYLLRDTFM